MLLSLLAALQFPQIDPIIFQIGPLAIRWYALAYIAGLMLGWKYIVRLVRRDGDKAAMSEVQVDDFLVWATIGVVLGGRLGYVLFYRPGFYLDNPGEILAVWQGGMSFHGGLLGVTAAMLLFSRKYKLSFLGVTDLISMAAPLACFLAASPTSSMANYGAGPVMWPGPWPFPMAGQHRATPARFTNPCWKARCCS